MLKFTANQVLSKPEQVIRLDGVRWQTYQSLLLDFAEDPSKKLAFDQGILEIMTPLPEHEIRKGFLGRLVWATTEVMGLEVASLCSTTLSRQDLQKGIEPDECFYIEQEPLVRGKMSFDFEVDPVPELAIAMDVTSSSLNRLDIYAALGVWEVWRFVGGDLSIYCLKDGAYAVQDRSQVLPIVSKQVLLDFLRRRADTGENALLREFRQWLQAQG